MDKYIQVLSKLNSINLFRKDRNGLESMRQMNQLLGNPQNNIKFIHVAGTNGKGSVALKMQKLIQQTASCGLFTSPHLTSFTERIKVNDQPIEKEYVSDQLQMLYQLAHKHSIQLTFFEYITNLALLYYRDKAIQYVSWEVGLGGRLDATNIIDKSLLSIITSIGFDHQQVLGSTLELIAQEKAGIIKPNCPVVIGPDAQPHSIFIHEAKLNNSDIYIVQNKNYVSFEEQNNAIVTKSAEILEYKYQMQFSNIQESLKAKQNCRMEYLSKEMIFKLTTKNIEIALDVGHNISAIQNVMQSLRNKNILCVYGTSSQKDSQKALELLSQQSQQVFLISADHFRSKKIDDLQQTNTTLQNVKVHNQGDIKSTIQLAIDTANDGQLILIIGSFYIMRESREFLGFQDICDPIELSHKN